MTKIAPIFFAFSLLSCSFTVFKTFTPSAYADDSLSSLQQDVIVAKEKEQAISGKMESVDLVLDDQKSSFLKKEAEDLIGDVMKKGYTSSQPETKAETQSPEIPLKPKVLKKKEDKPQQTNFWKYLTGTYGYKDKPLTEAEATYKVAVSDNKVTVKEAVDIGLAGNMEIIAARKKIDVADRKLTEARRALFPSVQGVYENYKGLSGQISELDPHGRLFHGRSYKLNVTQPIFYDGELIFTARQAEENLKAVKADYEKIRNDYIHQIRTAYYAVVKAEYNAQYQAELYQKVNELYKKIREAHNEKLVSDVDFLNAEAQYEQVFFQVQTAKNDLGSSHLSLAETLNLDAEKPMPVDLRLKFMKLQPTMNELVDFSMQHNPDIQSKEFSLSAAIYGVKIYKAKKLPKVDLRGSFGYLGEAFEHTDLDMEKEWFFALESSMPLGPNSVEFTQNKRVFGPTVIQLTGSQDQKTHVAFNLLDKLSDLTDEENAKQVLLQAETDIEKTKNDTSSKLRESFYGLEKTAIQVDSSIAKMRYQEKQNNISEYLSGMQEASVASLMEGLIEQAQNKFAFIQSVTDYNLALSSLSVTLGDPDYFEAQS